MAYNDYAESIVSEFLHPEKQVFYKPYFVQLGFLHVFDITKNHILFLQDNIFLSQINKV